MTISVIIPMYNGAAFIEEAINNLKTQTLLPTEIIVIDDGSTDAGAAIVAKFKDVIYKYQENKGPSAARNTGIAIATGELISFLDCDDLYPSNKLSILYNEFVKNPQLIAAIGGIQYLFDTEKDKIGHSQIPEGIIFNHVLLGAGLFKRNVFDIVGVFDESLLFSEDFDWYRRLHATQIQTTKINECCLFYRRHSNNYTNFKEGVKNGILNALHKSIAFKKAQKNA
jgi:glycosyltransferase involved in cell wall biosynthesis